MKNIVLEGPALGSGMEELARELFRSGYAPCKPSKGMPLALAPAYIATLFAPPRTHGTVLAQFHLAAYRRGGCTLDHVVQAEAALAEQQACTVVCLPPWQAAVDSWLRAHEQEGRSGATDYEKYKAEYQFYVSQLAGGCRMYLHYDCTRYTPASFAQALRVLEWA